MQEPWTLLMTVAELGLFLTDQMQVQKLLFRLVKALPVVVLRRLQDLTLLGD